jgi:eukaryotic-like serine/threonine-protein kinase
VATGLKHCPTCNLRYPVEAVTCIVDRTPLLLVPDPLLGELIAGKYRIESVLGVGGMATVYLARTARLDRAVAVKVFRKDLSNDLKLRERFRRESTSTRRLAHPNIIEILDQGDMDDGTPFMVMEYLDGQTLEAFLKKTPGPMAIPQVLDLMSQVVAGLARAHDFQVIHRDLKPDNLYIVSMPDGTERMKILDFGIARCLLDSRLTGTGEIFGTPQYMAPERITSIEAGPSADLYALGCIMFRCATGRLPFQAGDVTAFLIAHLREAPPSPRLINPEVPPEFEALMLQCLEKKPEQRPADARTVERALTALVQRHPRPRKMSGAFVARTPPARLAHDMKATSAGGMFSSISIERWGRRTELFGEMVRRAFPTGADPRLYAALGRLRATVTAMAEVHAQWLTDQTRADAIADRTRDAQLRFGRAMDSLSTDLFESREAVTAATREAVASEAQAGPLLGPFLEAHADVLALGSSPSRPTHEVLTRYRTALAALEAAAPYADGLRDAQAERTRREGDVKDLEFQIESLRAQLERVSQSGEDEMQGVQRRLEIAATQLSAMEAELVRAASDLSVALRGRRDLDDLFAALEADAA